MNSQKGRKIFFNFHKCLFIFIVYVPIWFMFVYVARVREHA